jgi:hypothetical protein
VEAGGRSPGTWSGRSGERRATRWNRSKEPVWGGLEEEVCLWRNTTDDNLFVIETDSSAAELSGAVAAVVCEMIMVNTMSCLVSWSYCWRSNCSLRKQRHLLFAEAATPQTKSAGVILFVCMGCAASGHAPAQQPGTYLGGAEI